MSLFAHKADSGPNTLLSFKAGRCHRKGKMVEPEDRRGLVSMYKDQEQLLHWTWRDRVSGDMAEDLLLFPSVAELVPVPQCKTGRVVMLRMVEGGRKLFYWLQEIDDKGDATLIKNANTLLKDPNAKIEKAEKAEPATPAPAPEPIPAETPVTSEPPPVEPPGAPARVQRDTMAAALRAVLGGGGGGTLPNDDLRFILTPDQLAPLLNDPKVQEELFQYMPDELPKTEDELRELIRSPQFAQAVAAFNSALQTGQLAGMLPQFGLSSDAVVPGQGVEAFLRAVQRLPRPSDEKEDKQ